MRAAEPDLAQGWPSTAAMHAAETAQARLCWLNALHGIKRMQAVGWGSNGSCASPSSRRCTEQGSCGDVSAHLSARFSAGDGSLEAAGVGLSIGGRRDAKYGDENDGHRRTSDGVEDERDPAVHQTEKGTAR